MTSLTLRRFPFALSATAPVTLARTASGIEIGSNSFGINIKDYGATGDGVADDTQSFLDAATALSTNGGGLVYMPKPPSQYLISQVIQWPVNTFVLGDGRAITKVKFTHNGTGFLFRDDNCGMRGFTMSGPGNPAFTSAIGIYTQTYLVLGSTAGAINFTGEFIDSELCYHGLQFEGGSNVDLSNILTRVNYGSGVRSLGAQGKWRSFGIASSFLNGIECTAHPTAALTGATPFMTDIETFANGGRGIHVHSSTATIGLQITQAFLNNDSLGEIFLDTGCNGMIGENIICQFAGDNPFATTVGLPYYGDSDAPGIKVAGTGCPVKLTNFDCFGNSGVDVVGNGDTFQVVNANLRGCGIGLSGRPATDTRSIVVQGGFNMFSNVNSTNGAYFDGGYNTIHGNQFYATSATIPALHLGTTAINQQVTGNLVFQNNGAGVSFKSAAGSTYTTSANLALGGATSIAGANIPTTF